MAGQSPATSKPGTSWVAPRKTTPLTTKMNRPSVSTVTGSVRRMRIGRTTALARPRTSAPKSADQKLWIVTDGMK